VFHHTPFEEGLVRLINTEGLVLIGPGSEWLWTAVSGLVLAITFLAIWRQLALARSANALYPQYGPIIRYWHAVVTPNVRRYRAESRTRVYESLDWLAERMADVDRARREDVAIDEAYIRATLDRRIDRFRDEIRQAEQVRTVIVQAGRADPSDRSAKARRRPALRPTMQPREA
jgi:hypothetical protein